jgi:hypothetical protein
VHVRAYTPLSGTFALGLERSEGSEGPSRTAVSEPIGVGAVALAVHESDLPPPVVRPYAEQTMDRFLAAARTCEPTVNCRGDSVQAKLEALLAKAYPLLNPAELRVHVEPGRDRGTRQGTAASVDHPITFSTPTTDVATLPPATAEFVRRPNGLVGVEQVAGLKLAPPLEQAWGPRQGDYDRAWRVTFLDLPNPPQLAWAAASSALTAVGSRVVTSTLRQGAVADAPRGLDDAPRSVGDPLGYQPGRGVSGSVWVHLFNSTEPPPRGISAADARRLAAWSTFLGADAFGPVAGADAKGAPTGSPTGGGHRDVAVLRVPSVWATHVRVQRAAFSDVDNDAAMADVQAERARRKATAEAASDSHPNAEEPTGAGAGESGGGGTLACGTRASSQGAAAAAAFYPSVGFEPLSLAEVEVFEAVHAPLHAYRGSSPLPASTEAYPLNPAGEPLTQTFQSVAPAGRWVLTVRDRTASPRGDLAADTRRDGFSAQDAFDAQGWGRRRRVHGVGSVGRWRLHLTDVLGDTTSFSLDNLLTVATLPKYGDLWLLSKVDGSVEPLRPVDGEHQWRERCATDTGDLNGVAAASVYRHCAANFGVGAPKGQRRAGSAAVARPLRAGGNTTLVYVPRVGYTGADHFAVHVTPGAGMAPSAGTPLPAAITLHVRECRRRGSPNFPSALLGPLCACLSPLLYVSAPARSACFRSLADSCSLPLSDAAPALQIRPNRGRRAPPVVDVSEGGGRCDPITGICAAGLPDRLAADPRPAMASWRRAAAVAPVGLERMCRACERADGFGHLPPACWSEYHNALAAYGVDASYGGEKACNATIEQRALFSNVRCEDDPLDMPTGHTPEPFLAKGRADAGRR